MITVLWITVITVFFEAQKLLWLVYWWRSFVSETIWTMKQFLGTPYCLSRQSLKLLFKKQWCIGFITGSIEAKFWDQCTLNLVVWDQWFNSTVIPRLTKIIRSGITFVSRNVMLSGVSLLAVSNVNNPVGLVGLPYVMWSAHFFVIHIQTEKISSWNGSTVHVCCFMLARASTKTFVSRIHIR